MYELNAQMVNQKIWAHDDFIHLLLGGGFLAFGIYVYIILEFFKKRLMKQKKIDRLMLVTYLLFPAIVNGFFMYQHLLLSMMIFCLCYIRTEGE